MEKCDKISPTSDNEICETDNNVPENKQKYNLIPFEIFVDDKVHVKTSQLLSLDGWESYQKELIQLCFEFWEVNETHVQVNDNEKHDLEIQTPSALFVEQSNDRKNNDSASKATFNNIIISKERENKECASSHITASKYNNDSGSRRFYGNTSGNIDSKTNQNNSSKIVDIKEKKRVKKKKFSFYKQMSKQIKSNKKIQSFTVERPSSTPCTLEDLWKCKKWLDSVERIKQRGPSCANNYTGGNIDPDTTNCSGDDEANGNGLARSPDVETDEMEQKVRRLLNTLREKEGKILANVADVDEQAAAAAKSGGPNRFRYLFKNALYRADGDEVDLQLLDDYARYIREKLHTWQGLLDGLEEFRRKASASKTACGAEDTRRREHRRGVGDKRVVREVAAWRTAADRRPRRGGGGGGDDDDDDDDYYDDDNDNVDDDDNRLSKFVESNNGGFGETTGARQRKNVFYKLLNKTKSTMDVWPAVARPRSTERRAGDVRAATGEFRWWTWNRVDRGKNGAAARPPGRQHRVVVAGRPKSNARPIRKCRSDTDLTLPSRPSAAPTGNRGRGFAGFDRKSRSSPTPPPPPPPPPPSLETAATWRSAVGEEHDNGRDVHRRWDDGTSALWEEREECFRTAVARLEYVGSTFGDHCRVAGMKVLCRVDVLASFGRSSDAVDLFVQSALPLSSDPELMIRKAEAAYDWKFFCYLSVWRHSYKDG